MLETNVCLPTRPGINLPAPPEASHVTTTFCNLPDNILQYILQNGRLRLIDVMSAGCTSRRMCRVAREAAIHAGLFGDLSVRLSSLVGPTRARARLLHTSDAPTILVRLDPVGIMHMLDWFQTSPLARRAARDVSLDLSTYLDQVPFGTIAQVSPREPHIHSLILLSTLPALTSARIELCGKACGKTGETLQLEILTAAPRLTSLTCSLVHAWHPAYSRAALILLKTHESSLKKLRKLTLEFLPIGYEAQLQFLCDLSNLRALSLSSASLDVRRSRIRSLDSGDYSMVS
jgi:hypothetical protein